MTPIFTPRKAFIFVPGHGVVEKVDFTQDHAAILLKKAEGNGVDKNKFISQHFETTFGDLPLFEEEQEKPASKPKKRTKKEIEEELLQAEIEEEENAKK
jgi:hypothetical protein